MDGGLPPLVDICILIRHRRASGSGLSLFDSRSLWARNLILILSACQFLDETCTPLPFMLVFIVVLAFESLPDSLDHSSKPVEVQRV